MDLKLQHRHKFRVTKESVFGLKHINAVLRCDGMVNYRRCPARLVRVVSYDELEKRGSQRPTFFLKSDA